MNLSPLPPEVYAETFSYSNGRTETIYRAPFESDGPQLAGEDGQRVLRYMYAAYVFTWPEGASKLDIGHGDLSDQMELWSGVRIVGKWHPDTLTAFAHRWTAAEFRKFAR